MILFHITPKSNLNNILTNGLIPQKKKRGKGFEESVPAIYFFNSKIEAEDGYFNWFEDCFDDDEEFYLLTVEISSDLISPDPELPNSCSICFNKISPEYIKKIEDF
jgi:hypothetical protein